MEPSTKYIQRKASNFGRYIVHCITALIYSQGSTCFVNDERNKCTFSDDITESPTKEKETVESYGSEHNALDMMPCC